MYIENYPLIPFFALIILIQLITGVGFMMRGVVPHFISRKKDKHGYWGLIIVWSLGVAVYMVVCNLFKF